MSKHEFLRELENTLQGEVSSKIVLKNVAYYETYIEEQIRKGNTEEDVLAQLGSPKLIARTIIDTNGGTGTYAGEDEAAFEQSYNRELHREQMRDTARAAGVEFDGAQASRFVVNGKEYDLSKWYVKALAAAIAILIVLVVAFILVIIVKGIYLAVKWLAIPFLVICLISYLLKRLL